jgi:alpha-glucosidase (family GH31 glycosyl hydrolase)
MYWSIPQALSMSLFGIPMLGPTLAVIFGNTDDELCNRWMQLSAFFPFWSIALPILFIARQHH